MNSKISLSIILSLSMSSLFGQTITEPVLKTTNENGEQIYTSKGYELTSESEISTTERKQKTLEDYSLGELEDFLIQIDEKIAVLEFQENWKEVEKYKSQKTLIQNRILTIKSSH